MVSVHPDYTTNPYYRKISRLSFIVFVVAAWFSTGYHHPDEHFQILEFCNYKLGNIPPDILPWEFNEQIRPALPVFIAYGVIRFLNAVGIEDPFLWAFVLRLLVAVVAWWIIRKLALILLDNFKTQAGQKFFFASIFLLWFVPYMSVRFSSENLGAIIFLYAVYLLLLFRDLPKGRQLLALFTIGFLLGTAFYFRFQVAFMIFGLGLWMVFIHKMKFNQLLFVFAGALMATGICIVIDYWFYGSWILSPFNYFRMNILNDVASGFGISPWWSYFHFYYVKAFPPVSIVLFLFFVYGILKNPKNLFLWCLAPFLLVHFMIGHKEMRFLFPLIFAFLYIASC
jgi:GPI mannosyltransferase 3